jgi:hypothetical protein
MPKTYRISSETINFSLVVPDGTPEEQVCQEAREVGKQIAELQYDALQSGRWSKAFIALVDEEDEEEDASTMLGRLCAEYSRHQSS